MGELKPSIKSVEGGTIAAIVPGILTIIYNIVGEDRAGISLDKLLELAQKSGDIAAALRLNENLAIINSSFDFAAVAALLIFAGLLHKNFTDNRTSIKKEAVKQAGQLKIVKENQTVKSNE
jgi:hypothetical protein